MKEYRVKIGFNIKIKNKEYIANKIEEIRNDIINKYNIANNIFDILDAYHIIKEFILNLKNYYGEYPEIVELTISETDIERNKKLK